MSKEPVILPTSLFIFNTLKACGFWLTKWYNAAPLEKRQQMLGEIFELHRLGKFEAPRHRLFALTPDLCFSKVFEHQNSKNIFTF